MDFATLCRVLCPGILWGSLLWFGQAPAADTPFDPGILKAEFVYKDKLETNPLTIGKCIAPKRISGVVVDVIVGLAGKLTESLIDAVAAKTQPEATTLDTVIPLEGFYAPKGVAIDEGCLVFHNGEKADASDASFKGIFKVAVSEDASAFRFSVMEWKFDRFLKPETNRWGQRAGLRDFVLKIEFLAPGSEGIGSRKVFVEHSFFGVKADTIAGAFPKNKELPWFAAPPRPAGAGGRSLPLNLRVTAVETTKPNQFALWAQQTAAAKKADVSSAMQDLVRKSLDTNYAAAEGAKAAEAAGTAYDGYKSAWDSWAALYATKPSLPDGPTPAQTAAWNAWHAKETVQALLTDSKRVAAKAAFAKAELSWPGDLPNPEG